MPSCPQCKIRYDEGISDCPSDGATLVPDHVMEQIARNEIAVGTMIGEYRVEAKIGEGGFGAVYRATQPVIGKSVAIKLLSKAFSEDPHVVSRFIAEARAVNQIHHKNIVDIFSFGALPDGRQYFAMELLKGQPLDAFLDQKGQLEVEELMPIMRGVLKALAAAHGAGITHRDLKPENVFLVFDDEGVVSPKLIDFGIAKLVTDGQSEHKTRTGTPLGTPYYMSPEQCRGKNVDHRTDIYSTGAMIHVLLTGHRPFDGDSPMDVLYKQMTEPPPKLSDHRPGLPKALEDLVIRMLEKDPAKRPQSAIEALRLLESATGFDRESRASLPLMVGVLTPEQQAALGDAKTLIGVEGQTANGVSTRDAALSSDLSSRPAGMTQSGGTLGPAATAIQAAPAQKRSGATLFAAIGAVAVIGVGIGFFVSRANTQATSGGAAHSGALASAGAVQSEQTPIGSRPTISVVATAETSSGTSASASAAPTIAPAESATAAPVAPATVKPTASSRATASPRPTYDPNEVTF